MEREQPPHGKPPQDADPKVRLAYWLSRPPDERIAEVGRLRALRWPGPHKMAKVVRVFRRSHANPSACHPPEDRTR